MPRKPARRLDSSKVQGGGSYVLFRHLLWGEAQELTGREQRGEITGQERSNEYLARQVAEWNWTDEDGKPLPAPLSEPSVIGRLTDEEAMWLIEQVNAEAEAEAAASKSG